LKSAFFEPLIGLLAFVVRKLLPFFPMELSNYSIFSRTFQPQMLAGPSRAQKCRLYLRFI